MTLDLSERYDHGGRAVAWGVVGSGPPLVLIHGTPFSAQVWRRIVPVLAGHYRCYYFDLLGYGLSDMTPGADVSLGVQNGLLAALFGHWRLSRPAVLAHDFGGATALRAYYLDGLRYGRLVLFDAVAMAPWGSPFVQHVRQHEAAFAGMPAYAHDALLRAYLQTAAFAPLREEAFAAYMAPWRGPVGQPAFYAQIAQMDQCYTDAVEPLYGPMDCDVQVLWGAQDQWLPLDRGQALADRLTGGALIRVEAAGHLMQDDAPEAIVAAVLGRP